MRRSEPDGYHERGMMMRRGYGVGHAGWSGWVRGAPFVGFMNMAVLRNSAMAAKTAPILIKPGAGSAGQSGSRDGSGRASDPGQAVGEW